MNIYISTTLHNDVVTESLLSFLESYDGNVGLEIFPLCHVDGYFDRLERYATSLMDYPITFHEPYYGVEHCMPKNSAEHAATMNYCKKTFRYASILRARHVVYHLNNCAIWSKGEMLANAFANLKETAELADLFGLRLLIENTGIPSLQNILLDQEEFTRLFSVVPQGCLIDVGHANCSGWDLGVVMRELGDSVCAYHVHNNFGTTDDHNRILNGTLNMEDFIDDYLTYTPEADFVIEYRPNLLDDGFGWLHDDIAWIYERVEHQERTPLLPVGAL